MTAEEGVPVSPGIKHVAALEQASRVLTLVCAQDEQGLMTGLALVPSTHLWGIGWEVTQQFTVLAGAANHTKKRGGSCWRRPTPQIYFLITSQAQHVLCGCHRSKAKTWKHRTEDNTSLPLGVLHSQGEVI